MSARKAMHCSSDGSRGAGDGSGGLAVGRHDSRGARSASTSPTRRYDDLARLTEGPDRPVAGPGLAYPDRPADVRRRMCRARRRESREVVLARFVAELDPPTYRSCAPPDLRPSELIASRPPAGGEDVADWRVDGTPALDKPLVPEARRNGRELEDQPQGPHSGGAVDWLACAAIAARLTSTVSLMSTRG